MARLDPATAPVPSPDEQDNYGAESDLSSDPRDCTPPSMILEAIGPADSYCNETIAQEKEAQLLAAAADKAYAASQHFAAPQPMVAVTESLLVGSPSPKKTVAKKSPPPPPKKPGDALLHACETQPAVWAQLPSRAGLRLCPCKRFASAASQIITCLGFKPSQAVVSDA